MSCPPEGAWRWLGGWSRAVPFSPLSQLIRLNLKFCTGCTFSWSCGQHNSLQGCGWWVTGGKVEHSLAACAAPHAAAELCWPHLSSKWGNLVVAINYVTSPRGCSSGSEPLPPQSESQNASSQPMGWCTGRCSISVSPVAFLMLEKSSERQLNHVKGWFACQSVIPLLQS